MPSSAYVGQSIRQKRQWGGAIHVSECFALLPYNMA
jgi:hypothetical protein